ncbi:MAG: YqgE/AlgH family protein [Betaproteobacteria bacterium]
MGAAIGAFAFGLFLAGAALLLARAAHAQDLERPILLVAKPQLQGGYRHSALLAVPTRDGRHVGFILNRATEVSMSSLFPEHAPSAKVVDPVYFGGPEALDAVFAVVKGSPGPNAFHLFGEFYVTGEAVSVDRIIEQRPNEARFFVGFVGWQAGELAMEIQKGAWFVDSPDAAQLMRKDTGSMWEELARKLASRIGT